MKLKSLIKNIWVYYLTFLAKVYLNKIKPKVIVVAGSVGKTSLKDFLVLAFKKHNSVVYSKKSYNSETGVPLAVFQIKDNHDLTSLLKIIFFPIYKIFFDSKRFDYLILEKDVQMPGEMNQLKFMTNVDCGILLNVFHTHTQFFKKEDVLQRLFEEFSLISKTIKKGGFLILNLDCPTIERGSRIKPCLPAGRCGMTGGGLLPVKNGGQNDFDYKGEWSLDCIKISTVSGVYKVNKSLPEEYVQTFGVGIKVCELFDISQEDIESSLLEFKLQPGRFTFLEGKNGCTILDSSYNSSPAPLISFLNYLSCDFQEKYKRKIVCLGEMRELGDLSESEHKKIIPFLKPSADILFLVGNEMKKFVLFNTSFDEKHIKFFENSLALGEYLENFVQKGDLVAFKGSQNTIYLEEAIKQILKNKTDVSKLCRQEKYWISEKRKYFK